MAPADVIVHRKTWPSTDGYVTDKSLDSTSLRRRAGIGYDHPFLRGSM